MTLSAFTLLAQRSSPPWMYRSGEFAELHGMLAAVNFH